MKIIKSIKEASRICDRARIKAKRIGFVPTMGALHEGHLSLIRKARRENNFVVVSIFVNPTQFGPREDFKKYPRNLKQDTVLCRKEGVNLIFYPEAKQMYPPNYKTYVEVSDLDKVLCAKFRPRHFRGVATVVAKLFNIVRPNIAYFGQKDAQQAIIIKKMADDLNMPLKIKIMPTVRQSNGLALSSRNVYLDDKQKRNAIVLHKALIKAKDLIGQGKRNYQGIISQMKRIIEKEGIRKIDYISIVDLENLRPIKKMKGKVLIALAVWIGKTRLIDNEMVWIG